MERSYASLGGSFKRLKEQFRDSGFMAAERNVVSHGVKNEGF